MLDRRGYDADSAYPLPGLAEQVVSGTYQIALPRDNTPPASISRGGRNGFRTASAIPQLMAIARQGGFIVLDAS